MVNLFSVAGLLNFVVKIPSYSFQVLNLPLVGLSRDWSSLETTIFTKLQLENKNSVRTKIHSLSIDLYFPDHEGVMVHIGGLQDVQLSQNGRTSVDAIWTLEPRMDIAIKDHMRLSLSVSSLWKVGHRMLWKMISGGGSLNVTTSGVTHITAPGAKFTLAMICDNVVAGLTTMGDYCAVHKFVPGWHNMTNEVEKLKVYTLSLDGGDWIGNIASNQTALVEGGAFETSQTEAIVYN
mmetsp:Transcript_50238/g.75006  ORF Transcript_50238/g.75006 Transcript_50238/m.75006 type:complete len:236 (-) Transcript_50238:1213-1920(-)